jgi:predicted glycosyltransferase
MNHTDNPPKARSANETYRVTSNTQRRATSAPAMRVALYSHDTMGLGHMRRNLLIAQSLTRSMPNATVLMIAGAKEANAFAFPSGVDCLTLPSIAKDLNGAYHNGHSRLPLADIVRMRSATIKSAIEAFEPDVLIVDKVPRGVEDELVVTLKYLRRSSNTRAVLGLREILDDKETTLKNWDETQTLDVIREYFDAVWVYGDPRVFNLIREYDLPADIGAKVRFTGYLDQRQRADFDEDIPDWAGDLPEEPFVLCVGGGQDGIALARTFTEAALFTAKPAVLVTGPHMPAEVRCELIRRSAQRGNFRVFEFVPEADWLMSRAERVVAMGGYNTICSLLSFRKPALVVPRVRPRREQLMRAQRLSQLGLIDMLHPDDLRQERLSEWLVSRRTNNTFPRTAVDLAGLTAINRWIVELVVGYVG